MGDPGDDAGQAAIEAVRAAPGSDAAWRKFYEYFQRQIAGALFLSGTHRDQIPDLTQEVFQRFLERSPWHLDWATLPDRAHLTAFLRVTARRVAIDHYRSGQRRPLADEAVRIDELATEGLPNLKISLDRLVATLDNEDRRLLRMVIDGADLSAIAFELGIQYSAAAARVSRLRKRIQKTAITK